MSYKWKNPHEWIGGAMQFWDEKRLRAELRAMAVRLDADTLQEMYESEMDADGYFENIPGCSYCGEPLDEQYTLEGPPGIYCSGLCAERANRAYAGGPNG
jgi:hypothetical protein